MIVEWHEDRSRYEAITSYLERSLPKEAGWRWAPDIRRWHTASEERARRLADYAIGAARLKLQLLSETDRETLEASRAADANLEIPVPRGKEYRPYQRAGIAYALHIFAAADGRGVLIADEMGLGKTIQAIGIVNSLWSGDAITTEDIIRGRASEAPCILVVCPASLRLNWLREWRAWCTAPVMPKLLDRWPLSCLGSALIVSYDSVIKWHPRIAETAWDLVIFDEMHLLKEPATRRYASIFGGNRGKHVFKRIESKRFLGLTGTPIVNRPGELWPLVRALDPQGLGATRADFDRRYATNPEPEMLDELHVRLRSRFMVRRLKADVLKELPVKTRQVILVEPPHLARIIESERTWMEAARAKYQAARERLKGMEHGQAVRELTAARGIALAEISRIRHETAVAKLPAVIDHLWSLLFEQDKLVVFAHHHDVIDGLAAEFGKLAVVLDGRTEQMARDAAVRRFQEAPDVRLFIGSIRAAGLGLTLTAASTAIFAELDWTPAMMMQAEDRLHRIGQHDAVLVQHLVIDGSIDGKMAHLLIAKQEIMDRALDGGPRDTRDILEEVMR